MWTADEDKYLRDNYAAMTLDELATQLGRDSKSIYYHASRTLGLGGKAPLRDPAAPRHWSPWTKDDQRVLQKMVNDGATYEEIAAALGRTVDAVVWFKRRYLAGAKRTFINNDNTPKAAYKHRGFYNYWTDVEIDYLIENYGRMPTAEIATNLARTEPAVYQEAYRLGLKGRWVQNAEREKGGDCDDVR